MRIGFFGGSFDPIHLGHTQMARQLMDAQSLHEVWFSPAKISPFKVDSTPISVENRIKMIELAIADEPCFRLYDKEAKKEGPSFTIETIQELLKLKNKKFYLMLSDESVSGFFSWKKVEEIIHLVPLIVGTRLGSKPPERGSLEICKALKKGWIPTQPFDISSTEIRRYLREGKDCSSFLSRNVLDFIYQNRLYSIV